MKFQAGVTACSIRAASQRCVCFLHAFNVNPGEGLADFGIREPVRDCYQIATMRIQNNTKQHEPTVAKLLKLPNRQNQHE